MNQINGRLELKQMYNKEFYELVEKYDLSIPQAEGFLTAYIALEGCLNHPIYGNRWEIISARRSITRVIYEASLTKISGFITPAAKRILVDRLLDGEEKTKLTTNDHIFSPQTYAHFICTRWDLFQDNLDNFFREMLVCSITVKCTVKENNKFKKYTVNDETTGNVLRLRVPTEKRYEAAGVNKLFNKNTGKYVFDFPFELSEEFKSFEKEYLLL